MSLGRRQILSLLIEVKKGKYLVSHPTPGAITHTHRNICLDKQVHFPQNVRTISHIEAKPGLVMQCSNPGLERSRLEDLRFKVFLRNTEFQVSLRIWELLSQ